MLFRHRTVRLRLTVFYGALFVISGGCLLVIAAVLIVRTPPSQFVSVQQQQGSPLRPTGGLTHARAHTGTTSLVRWTGLGHLLLISGIALTVMAVVSVGLGWFMARRMLRPLHTMTVTARRISERNLHERLAVHGPRDELKDLGDTFDELLGRLEKALAAQRQFAANASHELRTPLTLEQTLLESILTHPHPTPQAWRSACERVLASSKQQARLIEALLLLSRSQQDLDHREPVDLAAVAASAARASAAEAAARQVRVETTLQASCVCGDAQLIERLVSNLLQNAVRYNVPHGRVHIVTGQASLRITNTGPRIPADQVSRMLQPFQRLGEQRAGRHDGVGLGLSIVAAIATAHGAALTARPGPEGGLDVEVSFPPSRRAHEVPDFPGPSTANGTTGFKMSGVDTNP
jgi:signal transduction histidine kinase